MLDFLAVTNLRHVVSRIRVCAERAYKIWWLNLCSNDNHYTNLRWICNNKMQESACNRKNSSWCRLHSSLKNMRLLCDALDAFFERITFCYSKCPLSRFNCFLCLLLHEDCLHNTIVMTFSFTFSWPVQKMPVTVPLMYFVNDVL